MSKEYQTFPSSPELDRVLGVFERESDSRSMVAIFSFNVTVHN
jgi:hypothetical protein